MSFINMVESLNMALHQEMQKDDRVLVLGEDVGKEGGVFRVTKGLQEKFGKERAIDTPIAESGIVGTSLGLAVNGMRPVPEMQFSGFVYPAFNQIVSHAARLRTRSRGTFSAPIVIRMPCGGGIRALEHHSESMEGLFVHVPGLKVIMPSTPYDAKGLLISAIRDPDAVIFMEPKKVYRAIKEEVPEEEYTIPIGKAKIVREGSDITLISWGAMMQNTLKAAEELEKKGKQAEVIDLRTLSPLDDDTIMASVRKTSRCVIVHEAPKSCGLGAEIIARINEKAMLDLQAPVVRVTGFDTIFPLFQNENLYIPSVERITQGIDKTLNF